MKRTINTTWQLLLAGLLVALISLSGQAVFAQQWNPTSTVYTSATSSYDIGMAFNNAKACRRDYSGQLHAVWTDGENGGGSTLHYGQKSGPGSWAVSAFHSVSQTNDKIIKPTIAAASASQ